MPNGLIQAKRLSRRGLFEQIDWVDQFNRDVYHDWLLTSNAEYDKWIAQAEGDPITDTVDMDDLFK